MSTVELKKQILGLIGMQKLDSEIYTLGNEKFAKPLEIKALEASFEAKKENLVLFEKKSLDLQKKRKEKELELAVNAEAVKKLQGQLFSLKTNKEFQTMQQQIADAQADGSVIEEMILVSFEESDKIKLEMDKEKLKLNNDEKIYQQKKNCVEMRIKEIDERLNQLSAQRKQIIPDLELKMFSEYERILQSREGLAIVPVKVNSCGGCHMLVPPQVINLIKMYERIITCEVCNRILYIENE